MRPSRVVLLLLLAGLVAGCANLPSIAETPEPSTPQVIVPSATLASTTPTPSKEEDGPSVLRIWLPQQFDPVAENQAAQLLQARLEEFQDRRPGLQVEVRIKPASGPGGLLEALQLTEAAAPQLMPDLVALSLSDMESAALDGLLHPLDGLTSSMDDPDWYPYAQQMARIQNTTYGLPFSGDALVLVGHSAGLPVNWNRLEDNTLLFPAASPQALFSLSMYLSAGGRLVNEQGRPALDESAMLAVLSFYARGVANEAIDPNLVSSLQEDQAVWQAFREQRTDLAITWTSSFLADNSPPPYLAPIPGLPLAAEPPSQPLEATAPVSLLRGYAWALAGSDPEHQALAVELAEFLSASEFLAAWTEAARVLPTRPTALASWSDLRLRSDLEQVIADGQLAPGNDLVQAAGPLFQNAISDVLAGEKTPEQAAAEAVAQLK